MAETVTQNLRDAYRPPSNFLEMDVSNLQTVGVGRSRQICLSSERESKAVVCSLPGKAFLRQLPFRGDDGIFDDKFIKERKQALEQFINKVAGHPLAQNKRCLHMFLQDEIIDKSYTVSKRRHA
uniref:PX domain-containing protein n=1 Tax=Jaculus jaculus TaxID=51337 RepID=A0A8C5KVI5_JACJA